MQGTNSIPKAPLGNNSRPLQNLHHRTIRTNINFQKVPNVNCPTMAQELHYRGYKNSITQQIFINVHTLKCIIYSLQQIHGKKRTLSRTALFES